MIMGIKEAERLFNSLFEKRNSSPYPFSEKHQTELINHLVATAEIAKTIAENTPYLNPEKSYVYGLLHDYGRIVDERREGIFHGLAGYYALINDYPDIAKICLTHSFPDKDLDIEKKPMPREMLLGCIPLIRNIQYDDYDRLIQLCDNINKFGMPCTIEERYKDIAERYNVSLESLQPLIDSLNGLKIYFGNMCNKDVYEIIGLKNENTGL
ncbi:MAG: HD domain-containing protein [Lactobacillaceae bacterium]|jgi:hypothetical protein|nr:HD domain-containing protein [Lactobacillaceae bacterium]